MRRATLVSTVILVLAHNIGLASDPVPKDVLAAWNQATELTTSCNGMFLIHDRMNGGKKTEVRFAIQGDLAKYESLAHDQARSNIETTLRTAGLRTPSGWSFAINEVRKDTWALSKVFKDGESLHLLTHFSKIPRVGTSTYLDVPLSEVNSDGDYAFESWDPPDEDGIARCIVKCSGPEPRFFERIHLRLDSNANWRVVEATMEGIDENEDVRPMSRIKCSYSTEKESKLWSAIPETIDFYKIDGNERLYSYQFVDLSANPLPEEHFTLPHYGLPEYEAPFERWRLTLYISVFVALFAAIGLVRHFRSS